MAFLNIFQNNKPCSVFALVGESGTGKSFRANLLAAKYRIPAIIDDGLLIYGDRILAGHSAKREKTYMGAVRVALFDSKEHRDEIAKALKKAKIKKILIIGTSEKMVGKIAMRLQLPAPEKIIHIEDISTREEIEKAIKSRQIEGKHVIPVPSSEIKGNYPQIFSNTVKVFFRNKNLFKKKNLNDGKIFEKSIVEPVFSKKLRVEISEAALARMVVHCVREHDRLVKLKKIVIKTDSRGYKLILTIDLPYNKNLTSKIHKLQQYIIDKIESYTGILVESVNVIIDKIAIPETKVS